MPRSKIIALIKLELFLLLVGQAGAFAYSSWARKQTDPVPLTSPGRETQTLKEKIQKDPMLIHIAAFIVSSFMGSAFFAFSIIAAQGEKKITLP